MNIRWLTLPAVCLAAALSAPAQEPSAPSTPKEKLSYSIGLDAVANFQQRGFDLDPEMLIQGIRDGFGKGPYRMSEEEIKAARAELQKLLAEKQAEAAKAQAEQNKKAGEEFLAANRIKEGVTTRPSGLQYKILTKGEGAQPMVEDTVVVHYRGTLIDGREFDSSLKRGEPAEFQLNKIIVGWKEALQLMTVGSRWQIFIPSELAYGGRNVGPIAPHSVLIFEVELLSIKPQPAAGE